MRDRLKESLTAFYLMFYLIMNRPLPCGRVGRRRTPSTQRWSKDGPNRDAGRPAWRSSGDLA